MDKYKTTITTNKITDKLTHIISVSSDESIIYLKVELKSKETGVFNTEKSFRNNIFGLEEMGLVVNSMNTEDKVKKYFGIGDKNE